MPVRFLAVGLVAVGLGCATARPAPGRASIPAEELLAGGPRPAGLGPRLADDDVLVLSPEMELFLDRHVAPGLGPVARLRQLSSAIVDEKRLGLTYDESTRTAAETFRMRRGNCLSFSSMFIAMARHVGLKARFQEVDVPPDWTFGDDVLVLNRHVNVVVDGGRQEDLVIDFNLDAFRDTYDRRPISDDRALAHYDNNMAVERLRAGDEAGAFVYLRRSLRRDRSFSPAWTNLGILYQRIGRTAHAEASWLHALEADAGDLVAMSNLARLYERGGDAQRAAGFRRRVEQHRNANPYYRYQLAREAVLRGHWDAAIGHLEYAVQQKRNEDRFCFLLGVSHLAKGDEPAARRWFERAQHLASSDELRNRYANKVLRLLAAQP